MALVSALPLARTPIRWLTFLDRSDPVETFDYQANSGDNKVLIVDKDAVKISIVKGVCPGDWRGVKVEFGEAIDEPVDLDVDPTGMDMDASDAWVDMVDELGCDCSKLGGFPLWSNAPVDVDEIMGKPMRFHHRLTADVIDFELADGGVIYVFVSEDGTDGCALAEERRWATSRPTITTGNDRGPALNGTGAVAQSGAVVGRFAPSTTGRAHPAPCWRPCSVGWMPGRAVGRWSCGSRISTHSAAVRNEPPICARIWPGSGSTGIWSRSDGQLPRHAAALDQLALLGGCIPVAAVGSRSRRLDDRRRMVAGPIPVPASMWRCPQGGGGS